MTKLIIPSVYIVILAVSKARKGCACECNKVQLYHDPSQILQNRARWIIKTTKKTIASFSWFQMKNSFTTSEISLIVSKQKFTKPSLQCTVLFACWFHKNCLCNFFFWNCFRRQQDEKYRQLEALIKFHNWHGIIQAQ